MFEVNYRQEKRTFKVRISEQPNTNMFVVVFVLRKQFFDIHRRENANNA